MSPPALIAALAALVQLSAARKSPYTLSTVGYMATGTKHITIEVGV
jgi:hypothetical protein